MCQIFAGQDPANYQYSTRSVRLGGHATSIRLEATFWEILDELAALRGARYERLVEIHQQKGNSECLPAFGQTDLDQRVHRRRHMMAIGPGAEERRRGGRRQVHRRVVAQHRPRATRL